MIFSATIPSFIQEIVKTSFKDPLLLDLVGEGIK